jgi:glycosyltransferase involved in cell wall biosynthesis
VGNEDAAALLKGAGTLVFPSKEEGFGRPPLEAAVAGVPIVVSRISPHQEALVDLLPDEVLWVDPMDRGGWSRALRRASDGRLRAASEATRAKILERYSTRRMGAHMDRIYRRVLRLDIK